MNESTLCCYCDWFTYFGCKFFKNNGSSLQYYMTVAGSYYLTTNWSLFDSAYLRAWAYDVYYCQELYVKWEILRADGDIEMYNTTLQRDYNGTWDVISDYFYEENRIILLTYFCYYFLGICEITLSFSLTDLRYNGAQFTCILSLPECNTTNITDPITVNIQGEPMLKCNNSSCNMHVLEHMLSLWSVMGLS